MDYDALRMLFAAVNSTAMLFVIPPLIRRGRAYWPWVAVALACVGCFNFITYAAAPSPEKVLWLAVGMTAFVLVFGVVMGVLQRKYFEREKRLPETPASE